MKIKSIYTILIPLLFCFITTGIKAQDGNVIYFMQAVPQSNYNNPATIPTVGFYLGMPGSSDFKFGMDNGSFSYNNIFTRRADDSLFVDADKLIKSLKDKNVLSYEFSDQIFALGFKVDRSYFTFSVTNKNTVNANYTKDFMTFLLKGNGPFVGQNANLGDSKIGLNSYIETSLGLTREINSNLSVGLRFKYLIGLMNIHTERSSVHLYTNPNTYDLTANSDFLFHTSLPFDSVNGINTNTMKPQDFFQNKGIAFDFGGEYKLNTKFTFGLSVVDLGYIDWNNNVQNYQSKNPNASYSFSGFDINSAFKNGQINDSVINSMIDSLKNSFGIESVKGSKYRAPLKTKIYLTASYKLTKNDLFGLVIRNDIIDQAVNTSLTVSYNRFFGKNLSLTIANTIVAGNLLNPGGGFSFNIGFVQLYMLVDHSSSLYAADIKNFCFQFGLNFIGHKSKLGQQYKEPLVNYDEDRRSRKYKIINQPVLIDSSISTSNITNDTLLSKKELVIAKSDTLKTDSLKMKLGFAKTDSLKVQDTTLRRFQETAAIKINDTSKNVLTHTDTTNKNSLLPNDSLKSIKPVETIPAINKPGEIKPANQTPTKLPIDNNSTINPPAIIPNETTTQPKQ